MRIAIIHGYLLDDSGSAIYVRELTRELVRQGHEVTLVCQEPDPKKHDFINSFLAFDKTNSDLTKVFERQTAYKGYCRLIRPNIASKLLIYAPGKFEGFSTNTFQESPKADIDKFLEANIKALSQIFIKWPQDFIQANHTVMQPYIVNQSLKIAGQNCPYVVTEHGSSLNFTVKADSRMVSYALEGLSNALAVVSSSPTSSGELRSFATDNGLNINNKIYEILPGVDTRTFYPEKAGEIRRSEDTLVFAGRLLWTKGLHYLIAALPLILQKQPNLQLLIAGEGPAESSAKALVDALDRGKAAMLNQLVESDNNLKKVAKYGPVIPELEAGQMAQYQKAAKNNLKKRVHFMGHLDHRHLSKLYAVSDITIAPSVFPEAFGFITIEALASGSIPLATYHSGFRETMDRLAKAMEDEKLVGLRPGVNLTKKIADTCIYILNKFPTKDFGFRNKLHQMAKNLFSWEKTANGYINLFEKLGRKKAA